MKEKFIRSAKRLAFYSFLAAVLQICLAGALSAKYTYEDQNLRDVRISVNAIDVSLGKALQMIERKTIFKFLYNDDEIPLNEKVTTVAEEESLYKILESFAGEYGLIFNRVNDLIVVKKSENLDNHANTSIIESFKIKGKVTDSKGEPLIGANVLLKGLNLGASTNIEGIYTFEVPANLAKGQTAQLVASLVNYKSKTAEVVLNGSEITKNFTLAEDLFQTEEVVVTGIASKTSKSATEISVSRIPAKELTEVNSYSSFSQLLSGKVSGVQMSTASGNMGSGFRFYVRGGGGLNGNEQPIVYVDGVRINTSSIEGFQAGGQDLSVLSNLNPNDIESIEILKGPAAAATYGTSGSNGVVLIKTKKGTFTPGVGAPISVNYKYNYGFNEQSIKYSKDDILSADDANAIFRRGPINEHNLSLTGGMPSLKYYASYQNRLEDGHFSMNSINKNGFRFNISALPLDNLSLNISTGYTDSKISRPQNDNNIYGYLGNVLLFPESYVFTAKDALDHVSDVHKTNQFIGSFQAAYTIIPGLEANASIGIDQLNWNQEQQWGFGYRYGGDREGSRSLFMLNTKMITYDLNLKYKYNIIPDLSAVSIVGLQSTDRYSKNTSIEVKKFGTPKIVDIGGGIDVTTKGEVSGNDRSAGIFTEHQFDYLNTYLFSFAIRNDYASSLGSNNASVMYPKVSGAVKLEKLFSLPEFVDMLKIRASYGENGQLPGSLDAIPLTWRSNASGYGPASRINSVGNPDLKPERIAEFEAGFDAELMGLFNLEFSYYSMNATESIIDRPLAPSTGFGAFSQPYNIGSVKGHGFESLLQYRPIKSANYDLNFSLIWNYQFSEVTSLGGEAPIYDQWNINVIREGQRKHEFYYQKTIGAEFDPATGVYVGPRMSAERESLGNPYPDHSGSLTINFRFLKNFNFYALGEWGLNNKIFSNTMYFSAQFGGYKKLNDAQEKLAGLTPNTPEYISAANEVAKMDYFNQANFIFDAQFFALREVSLSYNLTDILKDYQINTYIKNMNIGISARNVWRSSAYKFSDFEVNSTGGSGGGVASAALTRGNDFLTLQNPRTVNFWIEIGF